MLSVTWTSATGTRETRTKTWRVALTYIECSHKNTIKPPNAGKHDTCAWERCVCARANMCGKPDDYVDGKSDWKTRDDKRTNLCFASRNDMVALLRGGEGCTGERVTEWVCCTIFHFNYVLFDEMTTFRSNCHHANICAAFANVDKKAMADRGEWDVAREKNA